MHDLIIKGGTLVDGTGAPGRTADVAVDSGRITDVGTVEGGATRIVDADGLLVTPGWVDVHTHYDGQATWDSELAPSSWHGVTTLVMGNCGVGFAPAAARPPRLAHRPHGGRRGHPRRGAGRGDRVGVGDLPRVPRRTGAAALDGRRRHPGPPRRGAGLCHGRAGGAQRGGERRGHRGHARHRARSTPRRGARVLHLTHLGAPGHRRRAGARHRTRPRTSCSASGPPWARPARASSSSPRWARPARCSRTSWTRSTGCAGSRPPSTGPCPTCCSRPTTIPSCGASSWRRRSTPAPRAHASSPRSRVGPRASSPVTTRRCACSPTSRPTESCGRAVHRPPSSAPPWPTPRCGARSCRGRPRRPPQAGGHGEGIPAHLRAREPARLRARAGALAGRPGRGARRVAAGGGLRRDGPRRRTGPALPPHPQLRHGRPRPRARDAAAPAGPARAGRRGRPHRDHLRRAPCPPSCSRTGHGTAAAVRPCRSSTS